jgi:hypothetical protein
MDVHVTIITLTSRRAPEKAAPNAPGIFTQPALKQLLNAPFKRYHQIKVPFYGVLHYLPSYSGEYSVGPVYP